MLALADERFNLIVRWSFAQDTVTGFLLAGVGSVDLRKKSNFLVVNDSALFTRCAIGCRSCCVNHLCLALATARDTAMLAALFDPLSLWRAETTVKQVEDTFKDFTNRDNVAIVLINQFVSPASGFCRVSRVSTPERTNMQ